MAVISWDKPLERTFETGVEKGVLYVDGYSGVAWNGLSSINETPAGSDVQTVYLDGIKILNRVTPTEYSATINAYTYPERFELCDGTTKISNGLYADGQERLGFGLAYCTKIGNGVINIGDDYKLHLVYNAMAQPTQKNYQSQSSSSDPLSFSWSITTKPIAIPSGLPSSHFIIDSRKIGPLALTNLKEKLYGTKTTSPKLPSPQELITHFEEWHVLYPSSTTFPSSTTYSGGP